MKKTNKKQKIFIILGIILTIFGYNAYDYYSGWDYTDKYDEAILTNYYTLSEFTHANPEEIGYVFSPNYDLGNGTYIKDVKFIPYGALHPLQCIPFDYNRIDRRGFIDYIEQKTENGNELPDYFKTFYEVNGDYPIVLSRKDMKVLSKASQLDRGLVLIHYETTKNNQTMDGYVLDIWDHYHFQWKAEENSLGKPIENTIYAPAVLLP